MIWEAPINLLRFISSISADLRIIIYPVLVSAMLEILISSSEKIRLHDWISHARISDRASRVSSAGTIGSDSKAAMAISTISGGQVGRLELIGKS